MPVATPTRETTVIIVEDDAGIRESLTAYLDESPDCRCLAAFPNAEAAIEAIGRAQPDVVIMDINLPGMSGIEATRELKRRHPALRILMLTVYEEGKALFESLKAGACGYLLKRTAPEKIIEAIHDAKAGGVPLNPQMAAKVAQFFRQTSPHEAELGTLTQRERETLELLAEGYLYKEIAHRMGVSAPAPSISSSNTSTKNCTSTRAPRPSSNTSAPTPARAGEVAWPARKPACIGPAAA